jgi:hypothetical protein
MDIQTGKHFPSGIDSHQGSDHTRPVPGAKFSSSIRAVRHGSFKADIAMQISLHLLQPTLEARREYLVRLAIASFAIVIIAGGSLGSGLSAETPAADHSPHHFLRNVDYGSQASFGPLQVLFNSGFDILRSGSYQNSLLQVDFATGFVNVWDNLLHPIANVEATQPWSDFVAHEIFPYKAFDSDHGHFVPNYFLHTLGEGVLFRQLTEWYQHRDFAFPRTSALVTLSMVQLLNEVVENGSHRGPNVDPIADILIFNPLGWLLFAFDGPAEFFSSHLQVTYWPGQATLGLNNMGLYNAGENFAFHIPFGKSPYGLFAYMGTEGVAGLSRNINTEDRIQIAGGYRVVWLEDESDEDPNNDARIIRPIKPGNWLAGVFWDRNDSLMLSVLAGLKAEPTLRLNLYPGAIGLDPWGFKLGAFLWTSPSEGVITGLSVGNSPLGLGFQVGNDPSFEKL